jgi:cyclic pyranopterin phosphate synthase
MPKEIFGPDFAFLPKGEVLSFEEIERVARAFVELGVEKLRITGGEPLVRRDLPTLIAMLAAIRRPDGGALDLTLTTNGSALRGLARPLAEAGLQRVTVSLDSLDDAVFGQMNGIDFPVERVLDGIAAAIEAGLTPVKVNMVVRRGINEASIVPMAAWARDAGVILRFIEYMDVGHSNGWRLDEVVPAAELVERIGASWPVEPAAARIGARSPTAGGMPTVRVSSGSSRRSPYPSAATARGPACPPTASSTRACSRSMGPTSARSSGAGPPTMP